MRCNVESRHQQLCMRTCHPKRDTSADCRIYRDRQRVLGCIDIHSHGRLPYTATIGIYTLRSVLNLLRHKFAHATSQMYDPLKNTLKTCEFHGMSIIYECMGDVTWQISSPPLATIGSTTLQHESAVLQIMYACCTSAESSKECPSRVPQASVYIA